MSIPVGLMWNEARTEVYGSLQVVWSVILSNGSVSSLISLQSSGLSFVSQI